MIGQIWHSLTNPANADVYESLPKSEIFTGIQDQHISDYRGIQAAGVRKPVV